jgi:hypothetical protein
VLELRTGLDLRSVAGRDALRGLLPAIDVFVETMRPGEAEELGLSSGAHPPIGRGRGMIRSTRRCDRLTPA